MKKSLRKFAALVSASVMCAVPMLSNYSASAITQYKTYVIYNNYVKKSGSDMAYFNYTFSYVSGVTAEKSTATSLCSGGYFRSNNDTDSREVQCIYLGDPITKTGALASTKFIVPMSTQDVLHVVNYSDVVIRDVNNKLLRTDNIELETILMGDVNLDGKVTKEDSDAILNYLANQDKYPLDEKQKAAADVYYTGDGVTASDALEIQRYVAGLISHF